MKPSDTSPIPQGLRAVSSERRDTEGKLIALDYQYELNNGDIEEAITYIRSIHGNDMLLMPIGGQSAGGGVFNSNNRIANQPIIGLIITPAIARSEQNDIDYTLSETDPVSKLKTHEFHINTKEKVAHVGAGVVLDQIVATVKKAMGQNYHVLGTDLTSSGYASAGATFMTGGMGPTRTNFALSVIGLSYFDGSSTKYTADHNILEGFVETYGWTSCIQHVVLPIVEVPPHEFGFAVPVNNTPYELGKLVSYFADKTIVPTNGLNSLDTFIAGIEIITSEALDLLVEHAPNMEGLDLLLQNCKQAGKDSVVFISGSAQSNPFENFEDPLGIFVDNETSGIALEQATPFENLQAMKSIREGAPELARRQFLDTPYSYKDHTDINVIVNPSSTAENVQLFLQCYENYKTKLEDLIEGKEDLQGNVQVYGHINPQGLDPHYRISIAANSEEIVLSAKKKAKAFYAELVRDINTVCKNTSSTICGGEKGIISNMKILNALASKADDIPLELSKRLQKQQKQIQQANRIFNWRAKI